MKRITILDRGYICRKPEYIFGYTGWPSVERLPDGTLIAVASGMRMGHLCFCGKTTMYISRDDGKSWLGPIIVNDTPLDDRDAGILHLGENKLLLTWFNLETKSLARFKYAREDFTEQQKAYFDAATMIYSEEGLSEKYAGSLCRLSKDGGVTWGETHRIPVTAPHGPIKLRDGRILILGKEYGQKESEALSGGIYACASVDDGATWEAYETITLPEGTHACNYHEPHIVELPDGRIVGHIRYQHAEGYCNHKPFTIFQTESLDGGHTWSVPVPLDCSGSPPHLIRHSSGALVCVYGRREPPFGQSAMISRDEGRTWEMEYVLDTDAPSGDLGYPCSVELADHSILTVYYQQPAKDEPCTLLYVRWQLPE